MQEEEITIAIISEQINLLQINSDNFLTPERERLIQDLESVFEDFSLDGDQEKINILENISCADPRKKWAIQIICLQTQLKKAQNEYQKDFKNNAKQTRLLQLIFEINRLKRMPLTVVLSQFGSPNNPNQLFIQGRTPFPGDRFD